MSVSASMSDELRKRGNKWFKDALAPGINKTLQKDRFMQALRLYQQAYNAASTSEEKAASAKNIGVVTVKLAPLQKQLGEGKGIELHFYKEALTHLSRALVHGQLSKSYEWSADIKERLQTCIEDACDSTGELPYKQRIGPMEEFLQCLLDNDFKAMFYIQIASLFFKEAITNLNVSGYKTALHNLKECYRPIEEAKRLIGINPCSNESSAANYILNYTIVSETKVLEEDCLMHMCIAESIQARVTGDELLRKMVMEEEGINVSMMLDIIDWYKKAILETREKDVEQEAIALSRLGHVYDKVMKNRIKAKENFHLSIQLALSMHPRTFNTDEWYIDATEALKKIQDERVREEETLWANRRARCVDELKREIKDIETAFERGELRFLQYIYEKYPPKNEQHKMEDDKQTSLKCLFKTAIIHYHPDKQTAHGDKWVVICEEICKLLTKRYELNKCDDPDV